MTKIHYTKQYTEPSDLVALLKSRGVIINNDAEAAEYIKSIGYYRLSAYMYPYLKDPKENHIYQDNVSFNDDILMLYRFDKKLKMLLLNEIEKIEVAVRSAVVNIGCKHTGNPFWMTDINNFVDAVRFNDALSFFSQINSISPMLPRHTAGMGWLHSNLDIKRTYFDICIIKYFIDRISPNNDMAQKLRKLLSDFPKVATAEMGFPNNWADEDIWKI